MEIKNLKFWNHWRIIKWRPATGEFFRLSLFSITAIPQGRSRNVVCVFFLIWQNMKHLQTMIWSNHTYLHSLGFNNHGSFTNLQIVDVKNRFQKSQIFSRILLNEKAYAVSHMKTDSPGFEKCHCSKALGNHSQQAQNLKKC